MGTLIKKLTSDPSYLWLKIMESDIYNSGFPKKACQGCHISKLAHWNDARCTSFWSILDPWLNGIVRIYWNKSDPKKQLCKIDNLSIDHISDQSYYVISDPTLDHDRIAHISDMQCNGQLIALWKQIILNVSVLVFPVSGGEGRVCKGTSWSSWRRSSSARAPARLKKDCKQCSLFWIREPSTDLLFYH